MRPNAKRGAYAFTLLLAALVVLPYQANALNLTLISNTDRCVYDNKIGLDRCNSVYEIDPLRNPAVGIYNPAKAGFLFKTATKPLFSASLSGLEYTLRVENIAGKTRINISATKNPFIDVDNVFCYDGDCDYSKAWWSSSYAYRYTLNVTNQFPVTVAGGNYSQIEIPDTTICNAQGTDAELILNDMTKMRFSNITAWNNTAGTEIIFQIRNSIAAGASDNDSYVFYCGNDDDTTAYTDAAINMSLDGREFFDVFQGQYSQSKWVYEGGAWNILYAAATNSYSNNGPSIKSWYKLQQMPTQTLEYVIWVYGTDAGNNGGLAVTNLDTGKTATIANMPNANAWTNAGSLMINKTANLTFHETASAGAYVRNIFITTDLANVTPSYTPAGNNNAMTYILRSEGAHV